MRGREFGPGPVRALTGKGPPNRRPFSCEYNGIQAFEALAFR